MDHPVDPQYSAAAAESSIHSRETSCAPVTSSSSLRATQDHASDNEARERPVREKLKKTSIASLPRQFGSPENIEADAVETSHNIAQVLEKDAQGTEEVSRTDTEGRGRPVKKRSFDDLSNDKATQSDEDEQGIGSMTGRERKRSKDVRASTAPEVEAHELDSVTSPRVTDAVTKGQKEDDEDQPVEVKQSHLEFDGDTNPQSIAADVTDQDMRDSAFSPRKKRSRDQMDADTQREQKIPATEEAKAHRSSEEYERNQEFQVEDGASSKDGTSTRPKEEKAAPDGVRATEENTQSSAFGDPSAMSSSAKLAKPQPASKNSMIPETNPTDHTSQNSGSAFASSGFAVHAASTTSPFSTLGSSAAEDAKPFGSATAFNNASTGSGVQARKGSEQATTNGFAGLGTSTSSGASLMGLSPFVGGSNTANGTSSGGNSFANSFVSNPLVGGAKLTSFAAPSGGDTVFKQGGPIKPIGGARGSEDENSGSEGDGEGDQESQIEEEEKDPRFQYQAMDTGEEGEDSVLVSTRARLFAWEDGWKGRGTGVFKFNVATSDSGAPEKPHRRARFVMRAHQTYRVLLNTPVFKKMSIGDPRGGGEPTGKLLSIAVIEDGKPIPYSIMLSDASEAKTLYREVQKLQEQL